MALEKSKIIGIDLGTTNSCVSIMEDNRPRVILNEKMKSTTPSIVSISKNEIVVGEDARNKDPHTVISGSKRLIGRKIDDKSIQKYIKGLPYKTFSHVNGDVWIKIDNRSFSPTEIGGYILSKMKNIAEKYLKTEINKSVITVPAHFNETQRQATKDAAKIAGLEVLRIINEPTAAALAYGLDKGAEGIVAVYDLGGGTFDVSILRLQNGVFEVLSTNGNTFLGGEDLDDKITEYLQKKYEIKEKMKILLKLEVEKAKIRLSADESTDIFFEGKFYKLTRVEVEDIAKEFLKETISSCKQAIDDANITVDEIKHVVLVGGMTKMPLVRQFAADIFKKEPIYGVDPDEVVAKGAAIQGGILSGNVEEVLLLDVSSLSIGIETVGGIFCPIIKRNTTLPTRETQFFTTPEDNQTEVQINIYQGERPLAKDNKILAKLLLKNIPMAPRNVPRIEVTFEADASGMYTVTAKDLTTGKAQIVEIVPASGLTKEEIDKILLEAENRKTDDKVALKIAEHKIKIMNLINVLRNEGSSTKVEKLENLLKEDIKLEQIKEQIEKIIKG